ncbi:hypothetical protein BV20DRAFT_130123 [Pilatotrama ljubarskyi]|nr:hypothetical protein BV20DRAFT_130123 [Pilatotrama ljubarskyi]
MGGDRAVATTHTYLQGVCLCVDNWKSSGILSLKLGRPTCPFLCASASSQICVLFLGPFVHPDILHKRPYLGGFLVMFQAQQVLCRDHGLTRSAIRVRRAPSITLCLAQRMLYVVTGVPGARRSMQRSSTVSPRYLPPPQQRPKSVCGRVFLTRVSGHSSVSRNRLMPAALHRA